MQMKKNLLFISSLKGLIIEFSIVSSNYIFFY